MSAAIQKSSGSLVKKRPAVELWLELETQCNLRCLFCYNYWKDGSAPEPTQQTTSETIRVLSRLLDEVDCQQLAISGGEPLLRSDLNEILFALRPYGIPTVLTTNGLMLTRQRVLDLMQAGITHFQVPLHSHCEETHDHLSGGRHAWQRALSAIASVRECGGNITPVFVATRHNVAHFPAVVTICAALGIQKIIFNRFIPTGLGSIHRLGIGVPTEEELWRVLVKAEPLAAQHGVTVHLGVPIRMPTHLTTSWRNIEWASCPVRSGQRRWTIGSDLSVRRCNHSGLNIGNLREDGHERLLRELQSTAIKGCSSDPQPCQFIEPNFPVQVRVLPQ